MEKDKFALAESLRLQKSIDEAIPIYLELIAASENIVYRYYSSLMQCYKVKERFQQVIELGMKACKETDCWESIKKETAWCIYFLHFKAPFKGTPEHAVELLETMAELFPQNPGLNPFVLSVFSFVKHAANINPIFVCNTLELLNPELLDQTAKPFSDGKGVMASHLETWVSLYSKALLDAGRYADVLGICDKYLDESFSYAHDLSFWLQRRKAIALHKQKQAAPAYQIMQKLCTQKQDWYLFHEAAELAFELDDMDAAMQYSQRAIKAYGDISMKLNLWRLIYRIFDKQKKYPEAIKMLKLFAAIRKHNNWSITAELQKVLNVYNIKTDDLPHHKKLYDEYKSWLMTLGPAQKRMQGKIIKILPHGKSGFIGSGSQSYFFRVSQCNFPAESIKVGDRVSFALEPSYDAVKKEQSTMAVQIRRES